MQKCNMFLQKENELFLSCNELNYITKLNVLTLNIPASISNDYFRLPID